MNTPGNNNKDKTSEHEEALTLLIFLFRVKLYLKLSFHYVSSSLPRFLF